MALVDLRGREGEAAVRTLLALAHGPGESLDRAVVAYREGRWILIGWQEGAELAACAGVERDGADVRVRSVAVAVALRGRGVGRRLLDAVADVATARRLVAETDDDSVGFYRGAASTRRRSSRRAGAAGSGVAGRSRRVRAAPRRSVPSRWSTSSARSAARGDATPRTTRTSGRSGIRLEASAR